MKPTTPTLTSRPTADPHAMQLLFRWMARMARKQRLLQRQPQALQGGETSPGQNASPASAKSSLGTRAS